MASGTRHQPRLILIWKHPKWILPFRYLGVSDATNPNDT